MQVKTLTYQEVLSLIRETSLQQKETDRQMKETDRQMKETDLKIDKISKQIEEHGRQIGGLNNSLGEYSENFLKKSVEKLLKSTFKVENTFHDIELNKKGKHLQLDAFGYSNSTKNEMYVVELKTKLRETDIDQIENIMENVYKFLPEHKDKKAYGIIVAINYDKKLAQKVIDRGFYFSHITGDLITLDTPKNFKPKEYKF